MKIKLTAAILVLGMSVLVLLTGCGNLSPVASFTCTPTSGEAPLSVTFDASASSDSDGSITSYVWSFGDGENESGVTASHTYTVSGTYTIQLTVTDDDESTHSTTRTIYVSPTPVTNNPPTAIFTASPLSGDVPLTVIFDASGSSDSDGSITSYVWSFGDGENESGVTASHTYTVSGTYTIQLTVTDDDESTHSTTRTIYVSPTPVTNNPPTAIFTASPLSGDVPLTVIFDASGSSDSDGSITSYVWSFGDGENESGVTASHTYTTNGTHTARLTVTDNDGATVTVTDSILVQSPTPTPRRRIGAICKDGWRSSATGSGACSHHGGVAYWLYSN